MKINTLELFKYLASKSENGELESDDVLSHMLKVYGHTPTTEVTEDENCVECKLCKQRFKAISSSHLKWHKTTKAKYMKLFKADRIRDFYSKELYRRQFNRPYQTTQEMVQ